MINISSIYKTNIVQLLQMWQTKDTSMEEFVQRVSFVQLKLITFYFK